ncbi:DUF2188 domain-containing protein [Cupriavidus nantongensis]|uniref:DUF2188 domain-containing protein n=1 Tax=Cupriavidus nantongensis TaxID=1796606 RepID=UPI0009EF2E0D|nr:DUF2188 domain-containing protein [Cupriavidus nantongensis]
MPARNIHVVPSGDGWAVEIEGAQGGDVHATQEAAITAGTERAKRDQVELIIHGRDGQIRERNSFGHDPRNVKG